MKTFVISDVHGCYKELKALLLALEEGGEYNKNTDKLVFLGDYIDRGEDSRKVIELVRSLQKDNKNVIAFLYSFVSMFALRYLFACIYTEILLITSGLCFVNTIFTSFILLLYFVYNYYLKLMPLNVVVICLGVFVFFEVCRTFLVKKEDDEGYIQRKYGADFRLSS